MLLQANIKVLTSTEVVEIERTAAAVSPQRGGAAAGQPPAVAAAGLGPERGAAAVELAEPPVVVAAQASSRQALQPPVLVRAVTRGAGGADSTSTVLELRPCLLIAADGAWVLGAAAAAAEGLCLP